MNAEQRLLLIAREVLCAAGLLFLLHALWSYEPQWTLPAALGCTALCIMFLPLFHQGKKQEGEKK